MTQVLSNLISNAIHYSPGGGRITVCTDDAERNGRRWATVTVSDTGMGIPAQELPHIFDRFFRGASPRAMQISGTGLGLAIVKEIVQLHGGRITVESEVDRGSVFTVWVPCADGGPSGSSSP
jgi:signal transduction histidine kinase